MLCSPRLSRPEIYWFHVSGAAIVRSSNRKGIRSDISDGVVYDDFLTEFAADPQYTSRYSKGGTAVAERANQTLTTIVCCLKLAGNFPDRAVSEFYDTAAHLHNRLPHGRTGNETTTPYELLHNKKNKSQLSTSHWMYSLCPPAWSNSSQEGFSASPQRYSYRLKF